MLWAASERRAVLWAAVPYVVALALVAFWPTPVDESSHDGIDAFLARLHRRGFPLWISYELIEFIANIVMFVPVGFFVVVLAGMPRWWLGFLAGVAGSCVIELGQLVFLPERMPTLNDVMANTTGAAVGTVIALVTLQIARSRPSGRPA
jgi:hypothetical protein